MPQNATQTHSAAKTAVADRKTRFLYTSSLYLWVGTAGGCVPETGKHLDTRHFLRSVQMYQMPHKNYQDTTMYMVNFVPFCIHIPQNTYLTSVHFLRKNARV